MAEHRTIDATVTVSTNEFTATATGTKVVVVDPYISIEQTDEGAVVTVTDAQGQTTATIYNGKDGADGKNGADGAPGAKGDKGDKGDPGEPGAKGDTGAKGADGAKGDKGDTGASGADGKDGTDGFSPSASVTKSGNTTTISITDKNGTTSAQVLDGVGDVNSVNGKTGAVMLDSYDVGALSNDTVIPSPETWTFTLDDGTTVTKQVGVYGN